MLLLLIFHQLNITMEKLNCQVIDQECDLMKYRDEKSFLCYVKVKHSMHLGSVISAMTKLPDD